MNVKSSYQFSSQNQIKAPDAHARPGVHAQAEENRSRFRSRVVAVSSGKGGVGKTNVAVNLGLALARRGIRVALLDADLGTANVDVVLGIRPRYHLHHVITGQKALNEIIVEGPYGIQIIPGASGLADLADLPEVQREILLRSLMALDGEVDLLLIDTGAGVGRNVVQFILAAGEVLLVTTPEPTAVTDAYALMKVLATYKMPVSVKLVINSVSHPGEGKAIGKRLGVVSDKFLGRSIETLAILPYDKHIKEAVRQQTPVIQANPMSPISVAINEMGERLWNGHSATQTTGISRFFQKVLAFRTFMSS